MTDSLGDRMKANYEDRTRYSLARRTYTIIRVDGKAFHTYTKGFERPFDDGLIEDMDRTAAYLCKNIMGAKMAYVQSDEISIVVTDFDDISTQAWFDNNLQKMVSIAASMATAKFNQLRLIRYFSGPYHNVVPEKTFAADIGEHYVPGTNLEEERDDIASFINYLPIKWRLAEFDARVFQIPERTEVENYLIWRQQDATRNSISSVAQSLYSHKELEGKSSDDKQEMIFQKGTNWNNYSSRKKRGGLIVREEYEKEGAVRSRWVSIETPIFTQEREILSMIPEHV